tara:strand:+ start:1645 stop:2199 length:555 start_codon:yes stop_codon:yes gene_type:complete
MGSRRVSRKRLYNIEKAGIAVDLESGAGIKDSIISATQHRQGQEIITEILMDLNPEGHTNAVGGSTIKKVCGKTGLSGVITKMTVAKYGVVTEVRAVVLEAADKDLDVVLSSDNDVAQGTAVSGGFLMVNEDIETAVGQDGAADVDDATVRSIYIVDGGGSVTGNIGSGKLAIYIHGFEVPADL